MLSQSVIHRISGYAPAVREQVSSLFEKSLPPTELIVVEKEGLASESSHGSKCVPTLEYDHRQDAILVYPKNIESVFAQNPELNSEGFVIAKIGHEEGHRHHRYVNPYILRIIDTRKDYEPKAFGCFLGYLESVGYFTQSKVEESFGINSTMPLPYDLDQLSTEMAADTNSGICRTGIGDQIVRVEAQIFGLGLLQDLLEKDLECFRKYSRMNPFEAIRKLASAKPI